MRNTSDSIANYLVNKIELQDVTTEEAQKINPRTQKFTVDSITYYTLPNGDANMGASAKVLLISEGSLHQALDKKTELKPDAILHEFRTFIN